MRRFVVVATCLAMILLFGMSQNEQLKASITAQLEPDPSQTEPVSQQGLSTPELIDQALERGEITKDERLLLLAYAIYQPELLPEKYQSKVGWYGTQYVQELKEQRPFLETQQSATAEAVIQALSGAVSTYCDAEDGPNLVDSIYFRIAYGTIVGLSINDYMTSLDTTYQIEVVNYGWAAPPYASANTFNKYPVQVADLGGGLYGYVTTSGGSYTEFIGNNPNTPETETASIATCMVLNSDFSQFPEGAQGALDSTTSHEYIHAIQFAYGDPDPEEDLMWYESVAAYMEDEIFDNANSDYQYLWPEVSSCLGEWPNGGAPGGVSEYSNFTFFRHVAEHNGGTNQAGGGEEVAQTLWKNIGAGQSGLVAMNNALAAEGVSTVNLPDAFHQYAAALKYSKACSGGYAAPFCFEEGGAYSAFVGNIIPNTGNVANVPGSYNGSVRDNYAINYVGLPTGSTYDITVQNTSAGGSLRASAICDTGTTLVVAPFPSLAGTGQQTTLASFNATACNSVTLALTNQSQTADDPASCTSRTYSVNVSAPVINTPTSTPTATATEPVPTATSTATATATNVAPTETATSTPTGTTVPTTPTSTATATATNVAPTETATSTPTGTTVPPTPTSTATATAVATATSTPTPTSTSVSTGCSAIPGNLVDNGDFEDGKDPWKFFTGSRGNFSTASPAYRCDNVANIQIEGSNRNIQLYQRGINLEAGKQYQLTFAAYSSAGHDLSVYLHEHRAPFTNYGVQMETVDLTTGWQQFSITFVASGFSGTATDARLRFWLAPYAQAGDVYWIDDVRLVEVGGSVPTHTPTPDGATPTPTSTPDGVTPTPTSTPVTGSCDPVAGNVVDNGDFEAGKTPWKFHTNSSGSFRTQGSAYSCDKAARIQTNGTGSNVQLYQRRIRLEADTEYEFTFAAYSSSGADMSVYLHNHKSPYQNYGLNISQVNLDTGWQLYTVNFTTSGFSGVVNDARLRFWMAPYARAGDVYWIDAVSIVKVTGRSPGTNEQGNGSIIKTDYGLLIDLTEAEFDQIVLGTVADGNDVGALLEQEQLFLPFVTR